MNCFLYEFVWECFCLSIRQIVIIVKREILITCLSVTYWRGTHTWFSLLPHTIFVCNCMRCLRSSAQPSLEMYGAHVCTYNVTPMSSMLQRRRSNVFPTDSAWRAYNFVSSQCTWGVKFGSNTRMNIKINEWKEKRDILTSRICWPLFAGTSHYTLKIRNTVFFFSLGVS